MSLISENTHSGPEEKKRKKKTALAVSGLAICLCVSALGWMIIKFSQVFSQILKNDPNPELFYWLISGYIICEVAAIPLSGKLVDTFGEKRVLAVGTALFAIGTLWCIISDTAALMVVGRCIEGAGAGVLFAVAFTSVGTLFVNHHRGLCHEVMTAAFALGSLFGTAIGWWFISTATNMNLDAPFYFLLVMSIVGGLLAYFNLPNREVNWVRSDIEGGIVLASLFLAVVGYTQHVHRTFDFFSPTSAIWILLIVALGFLLYHVEIHVDHPIFPMNLTKTKALMFIIMIVLCIFSLGILQYVLKFALVNPELYPLDIYGASSLFLFLLMGGACTSIPGCKKVTKTGLRPWMIGGSVLLIVAFMCFFTFGHESVNGMRVSMFILGAGLGCMVTELLCMMQAVTREGDMGKYSSGLMGIRMASIVVGSAIFNQLIMTNVEAQLELPEICKEMNIFELLYYLFNNIPDMLQAAIDSFRDTLIMSFIIVIVSCVVILALGWLMKDRDLVDQDKLENE